LVTDHYHDRETLAAIGARVKAGERIEFDPDTLQEAWVSKEQLSAETKRMGRGCMLVFCIVIPLVITAIIVTVMWTS
jgi:hypothetical protein